MARAAYGRARETYLAFNKMTNSGFCHDGDRDSGHDLFDHFWIGHAGYTALGPDVRWDALVMEVSSCLDSEGGYGSWVPWLV